MNNQDKHTVKKMSKMSRNIWFLNKIILKIEEGFYSLMSIFTIWFFSINIFFLFLSLSHTNRFPRCLLCFHRLSSVSGESNMAPEPILWASYLRRSWRQVNREGWRLWTEAQRISRMRHRQRRRPQRSIPHLLPQVHLWARFWASLPNRSRTQRSCRCCCRCCRRCCCR